MPDQGLPPDDKEWQASRKVVAQWLDKAAWVLSHGGAIGAGEPSLLAVIDGAMPAGLRADLAVGALPSCAGFFPGGTFSAPCLARKEQETGTAWARFG